VADAAALGFLHVVIRKSSEGKEGRTKIPSILFYYSPFPVPLVAFSLPPRAGIRV